MDDPSTIGTKLLEAFLDYAGASNDRELYKHAVRLNSVDKHFRAHDVTNHVKERCAEATAELLDAETVEDAKDAIRRGADLNAPGTIHRAISRGFADVVIAHPDFIHVDAEDEDGATALELACRSNDLEGAAKLLDASANPNRQKACGCTYLHHAVRNDAYPLVVILLEYGADVSAQDVQGDTPLHIAVEMDDIEIASALLMDTYSMRSIDLQLFNELDQSVLYLSVGSHDMTEMLLDAGAIPDVRALRHAARCGDAVGFDLMMEHVDGTFVVNVKEMSDAARWAGHADAADAILEWL